jgi:hypothetical protein
MALVFQGISGFLPLKASYLQFPVLWVFGPIFAKNFEKIFLTTGKDFCFKDNDGCFPGIKV